MGKQAAQALFNDSLRVLFIGNSYTFFNDMPRQLQALAASCGQKMSVSQQTHGGWRLSQHAASPQTLEAIRWGGWDFVVMQEQSKLPAREAEVVEQQMYASAASLDSIIRLYNPQAQVVLYQTWGHNIPDYEQMQQRIADSYLKLAHRLDARCAPVGMAWKRVRSEKPEIGLYQDDGSHPTADGSYLAACVLYATMTGKSFHSTYWAGLTPQTAAYLQQTAQEMVLANRTIWNLTKVPQPEAVTRTLFGKEIPVDGYFTSVLGAPALNMGVFVGIISGFAGGVIYNKYYNYRKLPDALSFFNGFKPLFRTTFQDILLWS